MINKLLSVLVLFCGFEFLSVKSVAQDTIALSAADIKQLSVEQLMNIEVTSVSKVPEKLTDVASAIQVITREDIQRSAATSIPEALKLASNLQVTQIDSRQWTIGARGFNNVFSNKLLVLIDGRTVYSPLFAGVFWDAQHILLEDVEQIEVISGPGAALWGTNAVNGIINIITKKPGETQGLFASAGIGTTLKQQAQIRYGGKLGNNIAYKAYGDHSYRSHTMLDNGENNTDDWRLTNTGLALDWTPGLKDNISVQGNFYRGKEYKSSSPSSIDEQNAILEWTHSYNEESKLILQTYFDRTWRVDVPSKINDEMYTYDVDLQHNFKLKRHSLIWGAGYRFVDDRVQNGGQFAGILPEKRSLHLFSSFIQDDISIVPEMLTATIGTKLQHYTLSGFEWQPSVRMSFKPAKDHFIWAAVSRAIRAPSRIDVDYYLPTFPVPPDKPSVAGGPNFKSEKLLAYEAGYRVQPVYGASLALSAFYNVYDDLYSVEALPGTLTYQIQNGAEGKAYGLEFTGNYIINQFWSVKGGYTYFNKKLRNKPGNVTDPSTLKNLGIDANHIAVLQSALKLPANLRLDIIARYTDNLPVTAYNKPVAPYYMLDSKLSWFYNNHLEINFNGQNLLKKTHLETGNGSQIPRSFYGRIVWRY